MNDAIEEAAKVLYEDDGNLAWEDAEEWERDMERATAAVLHKAGMLATSYEWHVSGDGGQDTEGQPWFSAEGPFPNEVLARKYLERHPELRGWGGGHIVRRGVTGWQEVTE